MIRRLSLGALHVQGMRAAERQSAEAPRYVLRAGCHAQQDSHVMLRQHHLRLMLTRFMSTLTCSWGGQSSLRADMDITARNFQLLPEIEGDAHKHTSFQTVGVVQQMQTAGVDQ